MNEDIFELLKEFIYLHNKRIELRDKLSELLLPELKLFLLYSRVDSSNVDKCYLKTIDGSDLKFFGEESWSYGGYDKWTYYLPIRFLTDYTYREELKLDFEKYQEEEQQKISNKREIEKQKKYNLYLELKSEFDS